MRTSAISSAGLTFSRRPTYKLWNPRPFQNQLSKCQAWGLVGKSPAMQKVFETIERAASSDSTMIIFGETGTGKELVALAIHQKSNRENGPFIAINCAAIPECLLESELFGVEEGGFTGAYRRKLGKFELANKGTLLLDEIGCMPMNLQTKLLRVLEEKTLERVGGTKSIPVDFRLISTTNTDLQKAMRDENFRKDLYYRLKGIPITLPPLCERKIDIPFLIARFLQMFSQKFSMTAPGLRKDVFQALVDYNWPGNVRELKNLIESMALLNQNGLITLKTLSEAGFEGTIKIQTFEI